MRDVFEVRRYDGAGRLGELEVPRAGVTVETPALLPVVKISGTVLVTVQSSS